MTKWSANKRKQPENLLDPATDSAPKPGDYPLGSLQSRAAARAVVDSMAEEELVIQIVFVGPDGTKENGPRFIIPPV